MAGLDPAIDVAPRVKPGGDDRKGRLLIGRGVPIALALSAFCLAACSSRIWQDEATADTVRLHWYTAEASIDEARSLADEHCRRSERRAEMVQEFDDGDITTAGFVCEPMQR